MSEEEAPIDDPVQWGRAELAWVPDGYRLDIPIWLQERASALFESRVLDALRQYHELGDADAHMVEFTPGRHWTDQGGRVGADPAALTIVAPRTLFALDPEDLRSTLSNLARDCQREADEQHARDEEIAESWLQRLRGSPG